MSTPHKCPCCDGRGRRAPANSLTFSGQFPSETCIACKGTGIVWDPEPVKRPYPVVCSLCGEQWIGNHACITFRPMPGSNG